MRAFKSAKNAARPSGAAARSGLPRRPALLRWMAGLPAGLRAGRRGSVLVLVLGALAMLAVVTLVYATVGQETRRTGSVVERRANVERTVQGVVDYIGAVIADDVFSTFVQRTLDPNAEPPVVQLNREAFDYGFTDPSTRSHIDFVDMEDAAEPTHLFNPVGTFYEGIERAGAREFRLASDPWLAATEPSALNLGGTPSHTLHRDSAKDWAHISNLSPDGRFVNLYNLRGNFDARPGIETGEMSDKLSRYNAAGTLEYAGNAGLASAREAAATPFLWDSRQFFAFRPANSGVFTAPNGGPELGVGDDRYPPYQWADADGDGLFDSRWFELVDASDPDNIVSLLPKDDRYRWFVAARVVDLSGLVNINTATDVRDFRQVNFFSADIVSSPQPLDGIIPLGLVPSDIDVRRVLTLEDQLTLFGPGNVYDELQAPVPGNGPDDYKGYDNSALEIAQYAYHELRNSLDPAYAFFNADPTDPRVTNPHYRAIYYRNIASQPQGAGAAVNTTNAAAPMALQTASLFDLADELELRTYRLANDARTTSRLESTLDGRFPGERGAGPMRSNRALLVEREKVDGGGGGNPAGPPDGVIDIDALVLSAVDIRQRITTLSGARPLLSTVLSYDAIAPINSSDGLGGWLTQLKSGSDDRTSAIDALRAATRDTNRNPAQLFLTYADALLPYSGMPDAWNPATPEGQRWSSAHYGTDYSTGMLERLTPELALRTAAHLTANMIDALDRDLSGGVEHHEQSAFTLITSLQGRQLVQNARIQDRFAWWKTNSGRFDLGNARLADSSAGDPRPTADAVNVFGIEAQPFLVEVATVSMYTDSPAGDNEDEGGTDNPDGYATIDGTVPTAATANPDFLGQIVAFQLTNPFDVEIRLTGKELAHGTVVSDDGYTDYYLEYGGHLYKLAELASDPSTGTVETLAVTLKPRGTAGSTRVFIAMNQTRDEVAGIEDPYRVLAERFRASDSNILPDEVRSMIKHQFGIDDPVTGVPVEPILIPRMSPSTGSTDHGFESIFSANQVLNESALLWRTLRTSDEIGDNQRLSDMLADRLAQPEGATAHLHRTLPESNEVIEGMDSTEEPSIALWASLRRRSNPSFGLPMDDHGFLPAYCLEAKWSSGTLSNHTSRDLADATNLDSTHFDAANSHTDTAGLFSFLTKLSASTLVDTIRQNPEDKNDPPPGNNPYSGLDFPDLLTQIALNNKKFIVDPDGVADNGDEFVTIRTADLLAPLGIGPVQVPPAAVAPLGDNPRPDPDEYMTLSEAIALALGYSAPDASDPSPKHARFRIYAGWTDNNPDGPNALDRGNLRLDRYIPFIDNADAGGSPGVFDVNVDERLAPGVPIALNILNLFSPYESQLGGMTRATPGLININTAPIAVLRTLPLLNPPDPTYNGNWPPEGLAPGIGVYPITSYVNDLATMLAAYRDKLLLPVLNAPGAPVVDFKDTTNAPTDPLLWDGRWVALWSGSFRGAAVREQPGFGSVGEILASASAFANDARVPAAHRMDALTYDGAPSGAPGLSLALYDTDGIATTPPVPDGIADDYLEKLLVAAGISNLVTVRSDYYVVWFILHGYQRSDVEDLADDDPLVPSVAKRFVMILDRSGVRTKGQKPRVLLIKEVPM